VVLYGAPQIDQLEATSVPRLDLIGVDRKSLLGLKAEHVDGTGYLILQKRAPEIVVSCGTIPMRLSSAWSRGPPSRRATSMTLRTGDARRRMLDRIRREKGVKCPRE
jgi:hypothetical protein